MITYLNKENSIMEMKPKILILCFFFLSLIAINVVSAEQTSIGVFSQESDIKLIQTCGNCTYCNTTSLIYPNGTQALSEVSMEKQGVEYKYNYTLDKTIGKYIVNGFCDVDGVDTVWSYDFEVSRSGKIFSGADGSTAIAVIAGVIAAMFIFMILSFKLSENPKTMPLSLIFMFMSITLTLYGLNLGWVYAQNIIQFDQVGDVSSVIFTSFLWIIVGVVVISMALMLINFIKQIAVVVERKEFGEDFDPISQTYE